MLEDLVFRLLAKPFMAGETAKDAIVAAKTLAQKREKAVINILGEHVKDFRLAHGFLDQYGRLLEAIKIEGLDINIAVKPSQLGLDIDRKWYGLNLSYLLRKTQSILPAALVEIDAEDHLYRKAVFETTIRLGETHSNQRLACQVNLQNTTEEIRALIARGIAVRLCKGDCYPGDIKNQKEIRKIYLEQASELIQGGCRTAIATHDPSIIDQVVCLGLGVAKHKFEFEMLMGIEKGLSSGLAERGFSVRRYVPCGKEWFSYGKRRWKSIPRIMARNWLYRRKRQFEKVFK